MSIFLMLSSRVETSLGCLVSQHQSGAPPTLLPSVTVRHFSPWNYVFLKTSVITVRLQWEVNKHSSFFFFFKDIQKEETVRSPTAWLVVARCTAASPALSLWWPGSVLFTPRPQHLAEHLANNGQFLNNVLHWMKFCRPRTLCLDEMGYRMTCHARLLEIPCGLDAVSISFSALEAGFPPAAAL